MKQVFLFMLSASLAITSCSKNDDPTPEESNTVEIGGTTYPTVKIGTQTWTTVNYNGSGGVNYNDGANDPTYGKLYSFQEVRTISGLPSGWRIPTDADVKKLLSNVGTKLDGTDIYVDADASKKLMSTTGWTNTALSGTNTTGLNLMPTGYLFASSSNSKDYSDKGKLASFWTSTTVQSISGSTGGAPTYSHDPIFFEISTETSDSNDNNIGLRGYLYDTSASGDGSTTFPSEKRSIRFVKDN